MAIPLAHSFNRARAPPTGGTDWLERIVASEGWHPEFAIKGGPLGERQAVRAVSHGARPRSLAAWCPEPSRRGGWRCDGRNAGSRQPLPCPRRNEWSSRSTYAQGGVVPPRVRPDEP